MVGVRVPDADHIVADRARLTLRGQVVNGVDLIAVGDTRRHQVLGSNRSNDARANRPWIPGTDEKPAALGRIGFPRPLPKRGLDVGR